MDYENENQLQETMVVTIEDENKSKQSISEKKRSPKKGKRKLSKFGRAVLYVILIGSLSMAGYSGFQLYKGMKDYRDSENAYHNLADTTGTNEEEVVTTETGSTYSYTKADFAKLAEINPDVVGWLSLQDTVINYPVVQGKDNEYYLHHLFTGEYNNTGCLFLDMDDAKDFSSRNSIIYAHHMRNGSMFAELEGYRKQEYYETHREMILQTPNGTYLVEPFAGLLTDGYSDYVQIEFADDDAFLAYVAQMREQSTFQSDVTVGAEDRILTMSTCRYDVENGRYAVFAKLTPIE